MSESSEISIKQLLTILGISIALFVCLGCDRDSKADGLKQQIQVMNKSLDELKKEVETLKRDASWDRFTRDMETIAYMTPGDSGYSVLKTDFGSLTVTIKNIQSYANGSRVTLRFGNPNAATLLDVSATVEWGSVDEKGSPRNDVAKSKDIPFNKSFEAGHWADVDVVLEELPPSTLGFIRVRDLKNKGIRLYQ